MADTSTVDRFEGWQPEALTFLEELEANNSRVFFTANRDRYDTFVRVPAECLLDDLAAALKLGDEAPRKIFRPQRDMRFSKDKTPYKTNVAGVIGGIPGIGGGYFSLDPTGLYVATGYYQMAPDQLERYRAAIDADRTGPALVSIVGDLERKGLRFAEPELKTAPRGYPRHHPRVDLLRRKSATAHRHFPIAKWLGTRSTMNRILDTWKAAEPLGRWLDTSVGPSTLPSRPR